MKREKEEEDGEAVVDEEISASRPDSWRDGGRRGQKWENE